MTTIIKQVEVIIIASKEKDLEDLVMNLSKSILDQKILKRLQEISPKEKKSILKQLGHNKLAPKEYDFDFGETHVKIGVISDSHYGNKHHDYFLEAKIFKEFKNKKVDFVIDAGDLLDGHDMHYGQFWEQSDVTFEGQKKDFLQHRPYIKGVKQYFVSGNHMYNGFDKKLGFNSGKNIADCRDDLEWLADAEADIKITSKYRIKVIHPNDGMNAYAISYKIQKKYEAMGKDAPDLLIVGHYHKAGFFPYLGGYLLLPGTTESQTSFQKGKGISVSMGGWIIDLYFKKNKELSRITAEFIVK